VRAAIREFRLAARLALAVGEPGREADAAALRDARADACHAAGVGTVVTAAGWSFIARGASIT
jgi:hypothetical protein